MRNKKIIISLLVILVLGGVLAFLGRGSTKESLPVVALNDTDWTRGATNAKVILIEYGDFQCSACAAYEGVLQKIQQDFKNDLIFSYRHFPLTQIHQNALPSAKASEAAGKQKKFWEMHDILYKNQSEWATSATAKDIFIQYAKTIGIDAVQFEKDLADPVIEKRIKEDYKEGLRLKVAGTPTFFLNGEKIDNPGSYDSFKAQIEEVIKEYQPK